MSGQSRLEIIGKNPIGKGLDVFRASFSSICEDRGIPTTPDALEQLGGEDVQILALALLNALRNLPVIRLLSSEMNQGTLRSDLLKLNSAISSDDFDPGRIKPLLDAALAGRTDSEIWDQTYNAVDQIIPPRAIAPPSFPQVPLSFPSGTESPQDVSRLKGEMPPRFQESVLDIPGYHM